MLDFIEIWLFCNLTGTATAAAAATPLTVISMDWSEREEEEMRRRNIYYDMHVVCLRIKNFSLIFHARSLFVCSPLSLALMHSAYLTTVYLISFISLFKKPMPTKVNKDYLNKLVSFRGFNNNKLSNCEKKHYFHGVGLSSTCTM